MIRTLLIVLAITSTASAQWIPRLQKNHGIQQCTEPNCQQTIVSNHTLFPRTTTSTYQVVPSAPTINYVSPVTYSSCNCLTTGICTCQNCNCNLQSRATSTTLATSASRRDFRSALLEAARQAKQEGTISPLDYLKIAALSRNPRILDYLQTAITESAPSELKVPTSQSGDWSNLIDLIKELIPLIIELIEFIGKL